MRVWLRGHEDDLYVHVTHDIASILIFDCDNSSLRICIAIKSIAL